ncbi:hypothetical protein SAMN02799624_01722 [Paenibacillus sp. UNC496MF]|uniref:hypothetical protein n=1 Tax=Paenibacillus sp. UNC496MF TaxID=1502753 RepID=UPI0008EC1994|nr:hypothetical protein [Paenibacillus sp. UNC496MF]SFI62996.1 hypothetical protein SAMN02799624_01722 [Paenibacillus sp. UNC496MF]
MSFAIGDWVQGRTKDGEMIQGFIASLNEQRNIATVHVVQSDHDAAVGTAVAVLSSWLKPQPTLEVLDYEGPLLDFIELALATRDAEWFAELTERLRAIAQKQEQNGEEGAPVLHGRNRLGQIF